MVIIVVLVCVSVFILLRKGVMCIGELFRLCLIMLIMGIEMSEWVICRLFMFLICIVIVFVCFVVNVIVVIIFGLFSGLFGMGW